MTNRHEKPYAPRTPHDKRGEPPGGYVKEEDRGDMPKGWKEVPDDEQHSPALPKIET